MSSVISVTPNLNIHYCQLCICIRSGAGLQTSSDWGTVLNKKVTFVKLVKSLRLTFKALILGTNKL